MDSKPKLSDPPQLLPKKANGIKMHHDGAAGTTNVFFKEARFLAFPDTATLVICVVHEVGPPIVTQGKAGAPDKRQEDAACSSPESDSNLAVWSLEGETWPSSSPNSPF